MKNLELELGQAQKAKACVKCGEVKLLSEFHRDNTKKDGHRSYCKLCKRTYQAEYRKANHEKISKSKAEYSKANREKIRKYKAEYRKANHEKLSKKDAEYRKANPEKINARKASRRATKRNATPPWLNKAHLIEIEAMYIYHQIFSAVMPDKAWHVDHIVPLQGRKAKGLHIPWNLRVIPASDNQTKNAKLPPVSEQIAYEKNLLGGIAYQ